MQLRGSRAMLPAAVVLIMTATAAEGALDLPPPAEAVAALWPSDPLAPGFSLGNHRAEVEIPAAARSQPAVLVHVVWRRRSQPNATIVVAARAVMEQYANASVLRNVAVLQATMHEATIVFEPDGASIVHLYFLPYHFTGGSGGYASRFGAAIPTDLQPDPTWLAAHNHSHPAGLPWANVNALTARTEFDSFTLMEQAAGPGEMASLSSEQPFVLFTEKRTNSIRMNVSKNDEFCIQNEEFCIKNEELCVKMMDFVGRAAYQLAEPDQPNDGHRHGAARRVLRKSFLHLAILLPLFLQKQMKSEEFGPKHRPNDTKLPGVSSGSIRDAWPRHQRRKLQHRARLFGGGD